MMQFPLEFEQKMKALLGAEWEEFYSCYCNDRYQALRFNPLKVDEEDEQILLEKLRISKSAADTRKVPWARHGYYYDSESRPGRHVLHECGLYYIQEPSAMSAAALLAPVPGMKVLDLCAAPGGKSTQLSSFLGKEGLLVSNEINTGRSRILSQNIERLGIPNCIVTNEDSFKLAEHFPSYFHAVLVDAPCSGEGMFRKLPIAVEEWSPENVQTCADRQQEILDNAAAMLTPGGKMVFSTCTFSPEENENQIASFLSRHPEFSVEKTDAPWFSPARPEWIFDDVTSDIREEIADTFRLWPHKLHGEGHFVAVLRKAGTLPEIHLTSRLIADQADTDQLTIKEKKKKNAKADKNAKRDSNGKGKSKGRNAAGNAAEQQRQTSLQEFLAETFTETWNNTSMNQKTMAFGDQLYLLPEGAPPLGGLHVQRAGLQLGSYKKDRFEPSHALALSLKPDEARTVVNIRLDDPRCHAFFRGETFELLPEDMRDGTIPKKGWCLVTVEGYSAGWGKVANGTLKNHYPKGLRYNFDAD